MVWDENRRKKSKRYIFLLNDVLLITKRDGKSKYWLRIFITLRSPYVEVENISSGFECTSDLRLAREFDSELCREQFLSSVACTTPSDVSLA